MKEMDDGARVWRVSNDESERIDFEMVDGWIGTLDTLFIFAGLFSAIVATFVTQTTQSLQQDYMAVTASLLTEMVALQRVTAIGGDVGSVPHSLLTYNSTFTSSPRDTRLNGLWIASLSLTLVTALMAGLIKQWLHYYLADVAGGTPKDRACIRQYRYIGLTRWGVSGIIEILPVLMNISLLLFFLGLVLFTQDLSGMVEITWFLVGLTCICFAIYFGSSLLPVWNPQCPYKTSCSKLYFGSLRLFWNILLRLFINQRRRDNESYIKMRSNLRHIAKFIMPRLSPKVAETEAVKAQEIILQQNVITEMGINSINPAVSDIAIQSMAALHAIRQCELSLPISLIRKLRKHFEGCFQYDSSNEYNYRTTFPPPIVERYSRAMLLFTDLFFFWSPYWNRILSFSTPPKDLTTAFLCTYAVNNRAMPMQSLKLVIQCVLDLPSIEVIKYPSHYRQLLTAIDTAVLSDLYSVDEREQLLVALVRRLSPKEALSLQEDLLIRCLYSSRTKSGVIEPLKEQAATEELNWETSAQIRTRSRETFLRFILLLPDIANCAISLGSEEQDRLLLYLSNLKTLAYEIYVIWDEKDIYLDSYGPNQLFCVDSLIKLLNLLALSWEEWSGDVFIRLRAIANLHNALLFHGKCDKQVTHAMFHWLLAISLKSQDCPRNTDPNERTEMENVLLHSLSPSPHLFKFISNDRLNDSLKTFCELIVLKRLVGLPSVVLVRLSGQFGYLLEDSGESVVLHCLDLLFRHFLQQDPLWVDPKYPMMHDTRKTTINVLVNFAHSQLSRSTKWEVMLTSWCQLVDDDKNMKSTRVGDGFEASEIALRRRYIWGDTIGLQDVLWNFEDGTSNTQNNDPWDITDVLWMYEKENSLGASLDLEWLKGLLDEALGGMSKLKVCCGPDTNVTQLFEGVPTDPYPLPNDQGSNLP